MDDLSRSLLGDTTREYKQPILAAFYKIVGTLILIATGLLAIFAYRQAPSAWPVILLYAAGAVLTAFVAFGIAQVVEFIARIEYHVSSQKNEAILHTLHKIEGHLKVLRDDKSGEVRN